MQNLLNVTGVGGGNINFGGLAGGGLGGLAGGGDVNIGGAGGIPAAGGPNMFEGMDKEQMMQLQMQMLSQLEKTDPKKFDEIMTSLEEDMKKTCEEQGIDIDEVNRKYDDAMEKEKREAMEGGDVKLPGEFDNGDDDDGERSDDTHN